jgi:hypothetical protein
MYNVDKTEVEKNGEMTVKDFFQMKDDKNKEHCKQRENVLQEQIDFLVNNSYFVINHNGYSFTFYKIINGTLTNERYDVFVDSTNVKIDFKTGKKNSPINLKWFFKDRDFSGLDYYFKPECKIITKEEFESIKDEFNKQQENFKSIIEKYK